MFLLVLQIGTGFRARPITLCSEWKFPNPAPHDCSEAGEVRQRIRLVTQAAQGDPFLFSRTFPQRRRVAF